MNGHYLMLVPDRLVIKIMDFVRKNDDDVLIFRPEQFIKVYEEILDYQSDFGKNIFDECSVAEVSEDTDGCLGQG